VQPGLTGRRSTRGERRAAGIGAVLLAGVAAAALGHALAPGAALAPLVALAAVLVALAQQTLP
jgi:hypothetical protein